MLAVYDCFFITTASASFSLPQLSDYWKVTKYFTYLIFVIFFTQAKFLENKYYTEKRVNYDKIHSKLPIFRVKSVKNLHRPKKIYMSAARGARDKYQVSLIINDNQ